MSKASRPATELTLDYLEDLNVPPQRGLNLRPLFRTFKRNLVLITGITGLVTTAALVAMLRQPSIYQGSFQLLVEPVNNEAKLADPSLLTRPDKVVLQPGRSLDFFSFNYPTQLAILQSPKMLSAIAEQVQAQYPEFTIEKLKKGLTVNRVGETIVEATGIIEVTYKDSDPRQVEMILNTIANKYLKYSLEDKKNRVNEGAKFIDKQLPDWQSKVNLLQTRLQNLQQRFSLVDPQTQAEELTKQIRDVISQQLAVQKDLQEQKTLYTNLQKQLNLSPQEAIEASALSEDPNRSALLAKLKEVERQVAEESTRFTASSPQVQVLQEKRQKLLTLLNQETQKILVNSSVKEANNRPLTNYQNTVRLAIIQQLVNTTNQVQLLEARSRALIETRTSLERQAQQFPVISRQYNDLKRQLDITTQTLNQLLIQREKLRVEAAQQDFPWELVSNPQIPRDADGKLVGASPASVKKLAIAIMGGLFFAIGVAVIIEKYRDIFYSIDDVKDGIKLPILGLIPINNKSTQKKKLSNSIPLSGFSPEPQENYQNNALFWEAFDSLYANVHFLYSAPPIRSLAVCSVEVADGKSTVALYLAQTAAKMGQRVLLIDANLRNPQLHDWLNLPNYRGLSELLKQKIAAKVLIERSPQSNNLFVLTSGQVVPDSPQQLALEKMQNLLEEFQANFDLIIYDTPNLLAFTDASFIAANTDGILMVIGIGKTHKFKTIQIINQLYAFRLPILGIVANYVQSKSLGTPPSDLPPTPRQSEKITLSSSERSHLNSKATSWRSLKHFLSISAASKMLKHSKKSTPSPQPSDFYQFLSSSQELDGNIQPIALN